MTESDDITPEEQGFRFPGTFEVTAVGPAEAELETAVPRLVAGAGAEVLDETLRSRASREGRYTAVTVSCICATRQQYDQVHAALRQHQSIRYTL